MKPRVPIIGIGSDKDIEISCINIDKDRKLILKDEHGNVIEPSCITVGDSYFRSSKPPKILRQLNADPTDIRLDTKQLLRNQNATLVVDTGYQDFEGLRLCVSASIFISYEMKETRRMANFSPQANLVFCLLRDGENPERLGWWDIIERYTKSPFHTINDSYGLVVDSDLRDLSNINKRTAKVWNQNYLPANFQILYASADVGLESYINKAIRLCDKRAKRALTDILRVLRGASLGEMKRILERKGYFKLFYVNFTDDLQGEKS